MPAVLLLLAVLSSGVVVIRAGTGQVCPSAVQVADALALRMPGSVVDDAAGLPAHEVFVLRIAGEAGRPVVQLTDLDGALRMERVLDSKGQSTSDCLALSETIAIVVERYFEEFGLSIRAPAVSRDSPIPEVSHEKPSVAEKKKPPSAVVAVSESAVAPPAIAHPHRDWELRTGVETRSGWPGSAKLGWSFGSRLAAGSWFLDAGVLVFLPGEFSWNPSADAAGGAGQLFDTALQLAGGIRWARRRLALDLGPVVTADLARASGTAGSARYGLGQAAGARIGLAIQLTAQIALHAGLGAEAAITRHVVDLNGAGAVARTPRVYGTLKLGFGYVF